MSAERTLDLAIRVRRGHEVNFGPDYEVASDVAVLIYHGPVLLGWADDYGTVQHPDHELPPAVKAAAERLASAARELWTELGDGTVAT